MQNDDVEIAAFCDVYGPYISRTGPSCQKKYLEMGKVPKMNESLSSNVKRYKDYRELLAQKKISMLFVFLPQITGTHFSNHSLIRGGQTCICRKTFDHQPYKKVGK